MLLRKNILNRIFHLFIICIFVLLTFSCGTTDNNEIENSFFYASIDGPSLNGEFRIDEDPNDPTKVQFTGLILPAQEDNPAVAILSFNDFERLNVTIQVPPEERLTELTDTHEFFGMAITDTIDEIILISKTVSIHVTRLKNNSAGITEMQANFEGVMIFEYFEDGVKIQEAHTVKGDFAFTQGTFDFY